MSAADRRPIFHVGVHKTATSWFQNSFYPKLEGYRYLHRRLVRSTLLAKSPLAFDAAVARQDLGLDDGAPAIICEEDLCGVLHNAGLTSNYVAKEIANQLFAIAPEARIVLFIREQTAMATSCYQQYLREGGTSSVHRYLFPEDYLHLGRVRPLKTPRFDFTQFEFDRLVAHYDSLFGRENVFVFAYEDLVADRDLFLSRFCAELALNCPTQMQNKRYNAGYRAGLIPIARVMNLFTVRGVANKVSLVHVPYWYKLRELLLERLNRLPLFGPRAAPEKLLGHQTCDWIRQRFWQSNVALGRRMGIDLAELGYATQPPVTLKERPRRARIFGLMKH